MNLMSRFITLIMLFIAMETSAQITPYESSGKKETATYDQAIAHYTSLLKSILKLNY
jgi:hypothetical protein